MMSEFRREEENEMRKDAVDVRSRRHTRNTDCTDRPKLNRIQPSPGPLSSLKAVIRRTKTNSQSEQRRDRRRPEITVLSAEPLDGNNWCPSGPLVLSGPRTPPPQVGWCADSQTVSQPPPSYDQVLKEKTKEEHVVKPIAAPRRLNHTSTSSTQTEYTAAAAAALKTAGKKPQKPPRPSLPRNKKTSTGTAGPTNINLKCTPSQENRTPQSNLTGSSHSNCTRSVTVYWDKTSSTETTSTTSTTSSSIQRPVPLPRIKSKKPHIVSEEPQTLVKISENSDTTLNCNVDSVSSNKYLEELLEVFSAENCEIVNQSSAEVEDADEMSSTNSFRDRIKAFENQAEVSEPVKPLPQARKPSVRPPVAAKPSVASKPQFSVENLYEDVSSSPPTPAPKPPKKPMGMPNSVKAELDAILAKGPAANRSRPSVLIRDNSIYDEDFAKVSPTPPAKPPKEPLRPNLNINNHNSTALGEYDFGEDKSNGLEGTTFNEYEYPDAISIEAGGPSESIANEYDMVDNTPQGPDDPTVREYENTQIGPELSRTRECDYVDKTSNNFPLKPQQSNDNYAGSRQSMTRRPTTIIVPNKRASFSDVVQDNPPPLPFQKPVGTLNAPLTNRHSIASFPPQVSNSTAPEPTLPPRRLTTSKTLPPRPPLVKSGPARPPVPRMEASGRSKSVPWDTAPKPQVLKPQSKGPVLPPRPNPGHCLYNKYTLQVPHAVAVCDYNGSNTGELSFQRNEVLLLLNDTDKNTFECQVGDKRGRVHKSRLKVITPLSAASDVTPSQDAPVASTDGLTVHVLYDFFPENPGELALKAGDVVTMVRQVDNEWYSGVCRESAGFFPINYVKVLLDSPQLPESKPKPPAPVSGPRCVARFDFEGEHSDELTFTEGDVIQLKAYVGQEWARGQLGAFTGIFPLQFVEIIEDLPPAPSKQKTQITKIALPGMAKTLPAKVAHPAQSSQSGVEWGVALYDFSGNTEGDLSFEKGDSILITHHIDEQWSSGRLKGREGMFPRAFVESKPGQTPSPNHQNGAAGGVRARALYDFASDCEEELSIKVGDIITNMESVDDEWFLGDLRGKRALVPKNYVQVM